MTTIELTLQQIERLLDEQKELTISVLLGCSSRYNKESTDSHYKTLPIDEERFKEQGMTAKYPKDIEVLKRYIK